MSIVQEKIEIPAGHSFRLLRWKSNLHDVELILSPTERVRLVGEGEHWHYHQALELILFEAGSGSSFIGDRVQPVRSGDVVLLGSNLPHYWRMRGASRGWVVQWHWGPAHHFWAIPETAQLNRLQESAARGIQFSGRAAGLIAANLDELAAAENLDRFAIFLRMLAAATAAPPRERTNVAKLFLSVSGESDHQASIQAAIRHVFENYRRAIPLEEILQISHMTKPTFSRQFKAHTGLSLRAFLQQIRLEAICHELVSTDRSVAQIASNNGFSDISFFNQVFRRIHACRPLDYRRKFGQKSGPVTPL